MSNLSGCPDNAIDIVTPDRVFTLVPFDDADDDVVHARWFKYFSNAADIWGSEFAEAKRQADEAKVAEAKAEQDRREEIRASLVHSGSIQKQGKVMKTLKSVSYPPAARIKCSCAL